MLSSPPPFSGNKASVIRRLGNRKSQTHFMEIAKRLGLGRRRREMQRESTRRRKRRWRLLIFVFFAIMAMISEMNQQFKTCIYIDTHKHTLIIQRERERENTHISWIEDEFNELRAVCFPMPCHCFRKQEHLSPLLTKIQGSMFKFSTVRNDNLDEHLCRDWPVQGYKRVNN